MLSKEDFFKSDAIDLLKIKLSYGTRGIIPRPFGGRSYYKFNEKYNDQPAAYPSQLGREDLSWEEIANFNAGIEFGILRKLTGKLEFYHKYNTNLLQQVPIPSTTGFKEQLQNAGEMSNMAGSFPYQVIKN